DGPDAELNRHPVLRWRTTAGHLAGPLPVRAPDAAASPRSGSARDRRLAKPSRTGRIWLPRATSPRGIVLISGAGGDPMDTIISYWPFVLGLLVTGAVSGVFAGLLGIGGGAIIVPALAYALQWLGFDLEVVQHVAVGTSLAIIIPTGL